MVWKASSKDGKATYDLCLDAKGSKFIIGLYKMDAKNSDIILNKIIEDSTFEKVVSELKGEIAELVGEEINFV
jgi:hypothetical protein